MIDHQIRISMSGINATAQMIPATMRSRNFNHRRPMNGRGTETPTIRST